MQVNDNLQAMVPGPSYCLLKVWKLTGNIRFTGSNLERPVSDGDADVV